MVSSMYDYSKFEKFKLTQKDFKIDKKRSWSCGSATFDNCKKVNVSVEEYGLSVGCSTERSQLRNYFKALDLMYILLELEFEGGHYGKE